MSANNRSIVRESTRWLRVGFFTLTTLGPVINVVVSRMRQHTQELQTEAARQGKDINTRSQQTARELSKRSAKFTKQASRELKRRSAKFTKQASRELKRRSDKLIKQVSRSEDSLPDSTFWTIFGFSVGLTVAGIAVYLLIRRRAQQLFTEDEVYVQLPGSGFLNGNNTSTLGTEAHPTHRTVSVVVEEPVTPVEPTTSPEPTSSIASTFPVTPGPSPDLATPHAVPFSEEQVSPVESSTEGAAVAEPQAKAETLETPIVEQPVQPAASDIQKAPGATNDPIVVVADSGAAAVPSITRENEEVADIPTISLPHVSKETIREAVTLSTIDTTASASTGVPPTQAAFLGIVSSKRYYPIETPLSQLPSSPNGALDIVYFTSQDEAKAQGYTIAE